MRLNLGANGPNFSINSEDIPILESRGFLDFREKEINARICLTEKDPNLVENSNGSVSKRDGICISGFRIRHFPENCCPFNTKPIYYILKISKDAFNEFLYSENYIYTNNCFPGDRHLDSRCKYDRFSLHYYKI